MEVVRFKENDIIVASLEPARVVKTITSAGFQNGILKDALLNDKPVDDLLNFISKK